MPADAPGLPPEQLPDTLTTPHQPRPEELVITPTLHQPGVAHSSLPAITGYNIRRELGHGGMGVVYEAVQLAVGRVVALKMILGGRSGELDLARFRTEAEAIARISHGNIVAIYEVGAHAGNPFFSLEFCNGGSLDKKLGGKAIDPREAARLVRALARGVQAAHNVRVLHRDLKPANVLLQIVQASQMTSPDEVVRLQGESYVPKITDFGLAKKLDEQGQTFTGDVMGTPAYMPPEQAQGKKDIGPAADVYALGVILYECLVGRPPFRGASTWAVLEQVISTEPTPPSKLSPCTPRDLEVLALRCLEKNPARRPGSALELADELGRFLNGEPIRSRPVSRTERMWRSLRRVSVVVLSLVLAVGVLGIVVLALMFAKRDTGPHGSNGHNSGDYRLAENHLDRALGERLEPDERLLWLARALEASPDEKLSEGIQLQLDAWRRVTHELRGVFRHGEVVQAIACHPSADRVLVGCETGVAQLWDVSKSEPIASHRHAGSVLAMTFSEAGEGLVAVTAELTGSPTVSIHDTTGRRIAGPFAHEWDVVCAAFSPDGRLLACGAGPTARVWDVATGQARTPSLKHELAVSALALSRDGRLATGTLGGDALVWDVKTAAVISKPLDHGDELVSAIAFVPQTDHIATGSGAHKIRIWEYKAGRLLGQPLRHAPTKGLLCGLAVSPDGRQMVSTGADGVARLWNLADREPVGQPLAHRDEIRAVAFGSDGRTLALGSYDRLVSWWRLASGSLVAELPHQDDVRWGAFSPDGQRVATIGADNALRLWHSSNGRKAQPHQQLAGKGMTCVFAPDGQSLYAGDESGSVWRWPIAGGPPREWKHGKDSVRDIAISQDSGRLATIGDVNATLWDANGAIIATLPHESGAYCVAFSKDGDLLLTGDRTGIARLWHGETGKLIRTFKHGRTGDSIWAVAFHPDGRHLVTACDDRRARVFSCDGGEALHVFEHQRAIRGLALDPTGRQLATASHDSSVRLWDALNGKALSRHLHHQGFVVHVAFGQEGRLLASASVDGTARLWDAALGRAVGPPLTHRGAVVHMVQVDASGERVLSCGADGKGRLWQAPQAAELEPASAFQWVERYTGKTLDEAGAIRLLDEQDWHRRSSIKERSE